MIGKTIIVNFTHTLLIVSMFVIHGMECQLPGGTWKQIGLDINGEAGSDESGGSVAMSADGNTIVIGAMYNDGNAYNSGHARVYSFSLTTNTWGRIGFDINGENVNDYSGVSVAISADGKTIAVGGTGSQSGHVRVYTYIRNASTSYWQQLGSDIIGEAAYDLSGLAVTMSNDGKTIAIGAPRNDGSGNDSGHVRVYLYSSTRNNWVQVGSDIDGEAPGNQSGYSVAMSGDGKIVAIGAPYNNGNGSNASTGHVRVYTLSSTSNMWQKVGPDIDGESAGDTFGWSVTLSTDGKTVAVGATKNDGSGNSSGFVCVYSYISTINSWVQVGLDINGEVLGDQFGYSVEMSGDGKAIVVGAPYNDGNGRNAGHVRVYTLSSTTNNWEQIGNDINGEAVDDFSGIDVAISDDGTTIAIGAKRNDGNGQLSGHVRVYRYELPPTKSPTKVPTKLPTKSPTKFPTKVPTKSPIIIGQPARSPTKVPTNLPTKVPTKTPSNVPTKHPIVIVQPANLPTKSPSKLATNVPTKSPMIVVEQPIYVELVPTKRDDIIPSPPTTTNTTIPKECDDDNDTTCGIFGWNIFCPFTFFGILGRLLFNICDC